MLTRSFLFSEYYVVRFRYDASFVKELVNLINKKRVDKQTDRYESRFKISDIENIKREVREFGDFECQHALDRFLYHYNHCRRQKISSLEKQPAFDVISLFDSVVGDIATFTHYKMKNEVEHSNTQPLNRSNVIFEKGEFLHPYFMDVITELEFVINTESYNIDLKSLLRYIVTIERVFVWNEIKKDDDTNSDDNSCSDGLDWED